MVQDIAEHLTTIHLKRCDRGKRCLYEGSNPPGGFPNSWVLVFHPHCHLLSSLFSQSLQAYFLTPESFRLMPLVFLEEETSCIVLIWSSFL